MLSCPKHVLIRVGDAGSGLWGFSGDIDDFRWSAFCLFAGGAWVWISISCVVDLVCNGGDGGCVVNKGLEVSGVVAPVTAQRGFKEVVVEFGL